MPNETWQSDFTHYRLDRPHGRSQGRRDHHLARRLHPLRPARRPPTARITTPIVVATFREAAGQHGIPASTLTDNGMVYTVRLAGHGRRAARNAFEQQLRDLDIVQKNSRPGHPTTCGKVERFQQTMKKWLRAQPVQPTHHRRAPGPARRASSTSTTTAARTDPCPTGPPRRPLYDSMPKALPGPTPRPRDPRTDPARPRRQSRLRHPAPSTADCTTSASAEPTPEPASSCSSKTSSITHRQRHHRRAPPRADPRPHRDYQPTETPETRK